MRNYQLVLVLKVSLGEANRKKLIETVKSWVKNAKFTKEEDWGKKILSYSIKREKEGQYLNFLMEVKDEFAKDFEKKLVANENILRHLLLRSK